MPETSRWGSGSARCGDDDVHVSTVSRVRLDLWELAFPSVCAGCDRRGPAPCPSCVAGMRPVGLVPSPPGLDAVVALVELDQLSGRFVKAMKYSNHRDALRPFAAAMAEAVGWRPDVVTWVPTTHGRKRRRGYDQAELLARAVAQVLGSSARGLLCRVDSGSQTRRSRDERLHAVQLSATGPAPRRVLVVDDVMTTGSSLASAAAAVRDAGASEVGAVVIAVNL